MNIQGRNGSKGTSCRKEAGPKKKPAATKGAYFGTSGMLLSKAIDEPRRMICHSARRRNKKERGERNKKKRVKKRREKNHTFKQQLNSRNNNGETAKKEFNTLKRYLCKLNVLSGSDHQFLHTAVRYYTNKICLPHLPI